MEGLGLCYGLSLPDLFDRDGLERLDGPSSTISVLSKPTCVAISIAASRACGSVKPSPDGGIA
jgi:hypothetical protein